eukprot:TRINITY_DN28916_c0_g1_i1.p1 TRINITY_DN28916_c0_g1~~TRINITY_DN28916_c0_g1_i1.p1  ORF type:complete len:398 (+),score=147.16 TRINITY_DN28916_c0_g1_i1:67-1260(+)
MSDTSTEASEDVQFDVAVVIDNGSGALKVGTAADSKPQAVIPNIVGRPNAGRGLLKRNKQNAEDAAKVYYGDEVLEKAGHININYPMADGIVTDFSDMQSLWEYAYEQIDEEPSDQPVLLTEAPFNPRKNREKMAEIFFEAMEVPALQIKMQALCALYASGRTTGVVLDSGDGVTHTVPVIEGFVQKHGIFRSNIAGREVTRVLQRMLFQKGYNFSTQREMQFVREVKEECCYVAQDFSDEIDRCTKANRDGEDDFDKSFTLPDGQRITLTDERFKAPEVLFNPTRMDSEEDGWHKLVWKTVQKVDIDSRREAMENIVLSGGNTLFKGLGKRLQSEVTDLKGYNSAIVKVLEDPERANLVFSGAAVLSSLPSFRTEWVTAEKYEEEGTNCIEHDCFS